MLHTKFRGNRPAGSGEEDFWRVLTIYGRGGHLGHVTQMPRTKFRSPYLRRLNIKFGFDRPSGFGEEDVWNCLRRTDDGRTPDHEYPISSPMSLWLRWANNVYLPHSWSAPLLSQAGLLMMRLTWKWCLMSYYFAYANVIRLKCKF